MCGLVYTSLSIVPADDVGTNRLKFLDIVYGDMKWKKRLPSGNIQRSSMGGGS